jgi:protein-tyrosine-phosphatase/predicted ATP-grasp superfamily ATP-dependent carboligase
MSDQKVLVLGDDTRSFLAIARSLGRRGISIHAAPSNFRSPALRSRYIAAVHDLPPWMGEGEEWLHATAALLRAEQYSLVIPCNEGTLLPLQRYRVILSQLTCLAIPDDRAISVLFDKHETRELARQVGVRIARGLLARPDLTPEDVITGLGLPIVVKPRWSYSLDKLAVRSKVHVIDKPATLRSYLAQCSNDDLLEEYFPGRGIGVSILASNGRLLQAFEHHRVREIAGASFYRCSAPLTSELLQACEAMIVSLTYTGIAMFEFKQNIAGEWILLEVNARPWGSMPLPLALGVDFPYRWYRLLVAGEESPEKRYRTGVYGRNLIPDLQNSRIEAEVMQLGPVATAWFMTKRLAELSRFLTRREVHDVLVRDDPLPALVEVFELASTVLRRMVGLIPGNGARRRRRARRRVNRLQSHGTDGLRIVFVCLGNICRSPFAEGLLRDRLRDFAIGVKSCGMLPQPGRPTPVLGIEAAAEHGIDLSQHRSVWLTRQLAETATLLVVFDVATRDAVLDRYSDVKAPVICLGDLAGIGDVSDPVDGGPVEFRRCYTEIAAAIAELARLIRAFPRHGCDVLPVRGSIHRGSRASRSSSVKHGN